MPNRHERRLARRAARDGAAAEARSGFTRFMRERPLLVVGAGIALGMTLGALLPWRIVEDEFLGEQADKLKDGAIDLASDGYDKIKSVAQSTYAAATETLRGTGSAAGEAGSKGSATTANTVGTAPYHQ